MVPMFEEIDSQPDVPVTLEPVIIEGKRSE
jgi:hypothetical protein